MMRRALAPLLLATALAACNSNNGNGSVGTPTPTPTPTATATATPSPTPPTAAVSSTTVTTFESPWAMTFLPDGRMLVTEKGGALYSVTDAGVKTRLGGTPAVVDAGQGGLLDVALDRDFASNRRVYLSFSESGTGGTGLAVARGTLNTAGTNLEGTSVIWRQTPKIANDTRHFGGRIALSPDGFLFVTAGERHQGAPAQDLSGTLGKIVRLNLDGTPAFGNPYTESTGLPSAIWTLGHRNPYGLVFATDGRLFSSEMGPDAGDEFNLIARGANYGWRLVSEGSDGGEVLPRHSTRPDLTAPLFSWTPVIAPSGMIQYTGTRFVGWTGDFVLGGLVSQGLVRVRVSGSTATEVSRVALGARIREVEQGPDGAIWVLEDGAGARLRKLVPAG